MKESADSKLESKYLYYNYKENKRWSLLFITII